MSEPSLATPCIMPTLGSESSALDLRLVNLVEVVGLVKSLCVLFLRLST
jgi:hypothetical protein